MMNSESGVKKSRGILCVGLSLGLIWLGACASPPPPLMSMVAGTWEEAGGAKMVIAETGVVQYDSIFAGTQWYMIQADGQLHPLGTVAQGSIARYSVSVDAAGGITLARHTCRLVQGGVTTEWKESGQGTIDTPTQMTISFLDEYPEYQTSTAVYTKQ